MAALVAGGLMAFASGCTSSRTSSSGSLPALRPGGRLDAYVHRLSAEDRFSGAILVARGSRPILTRVYGPANKQTGVPNRIDTKFNLGSACKMFTGVAIAQLVQRGKLRFNEPIGKYLPGFPPPVAKHVTVQDLLTHTSGMGDFFQDPAYQPNRMRTVDEILSVIKREPLSFTPGTHFQYSNSGFVVLGAIIERLTGQSYYEYIQNHIFRVAGMKSSGFYQSDQQVPNLAHGYTATNGNDRRVGPRMDNLPLLPLRGSPAGGGYSTVGDMLRFGLALRQHRLLNARYTRAVLLGRVHMVRRNGTIDPHQMYGYGFGNLVTHGRRIVGHNGGAPGTAAQFDLYPALGYTVVILENYDPGADFESLVQLERRIIVTEAH